MCVDDAEMEISHIIRGEDHLSNTPKHILLFEALGATVPQFAHLPLILNPDRTKMSKRKSQTAVADYRAQGYIPRRSSTSWRCSAGRAAPRRRSSRSTSSASASSSSACSRAAPSSTSERLEWLNGQWIRRLSDEELVERLLPFLVDGLRAAEANGIGRSDMPTAEDVRAADADGPRATAHAGGIGPMVDYLFVDDVRVDPAALVPKRWDAATTLEALDRGAPASSPRSGAVSFEADELEAPLRALAEERGWKVGDLFMAIRVAVTGRTATPPLFDTLVALGYERTLGGSTRPRGAREGRRLVSLTVAVRFGDERRRRRPSAALTRRRYGSRHNGASGPDA